eukprot:scaffold34546_cov18-Tisochrysis_lutea.AAC.1
MEWQGQQQDVLNLQLQQQQQQQQQQQHKPQELAGLPLLRQQPRRGLMHHDFAMTIQQAEAVFLQSMVTDTHSCAGTPRLCMFDEAEAAQHTGVCTHSCEGTPRLCRFDGADAAQHTGVWKSIRGHVSCVLV